MAKNTTVPARGDSAATGAPKSIAPTRPARVPSPDIVSTPRAEQNVGSKYGLNGFEGRSSTSPGETVMSPLAESIKSASDDGESILDSVIAHGTATPLPDWQTRDIDRSQHVPTTFGHRDPNANLAKVPGSIPGGVSSGGNNSAFSAELAARQHGKK